MFLFSVCFLLGDVYLQTLASLPSRSSIIIAAILIINTWCIVKKSFKYNHLMLAFAAGFLWPAWYASGVLSWTLPHHLEGKPVLVKGKIASLPVHHVFGKQFEFKLKNTNALIRLTCPENMDLRAGDTWQFLVKLKRIHGTQNPGGFDFEAWALQKGLRASGWVINSEQNIRLSHAWYHYPLQRIRQLLQEKINATLKETRTLPWIKALTIGERGDANPADWQVLRNTGTNHLMVVGGLHIGLIAGFVHWLVSFCWRRHEKLSLLLPAQEASACAALIAALMYGALSGYLIPTQRACIMLSVFIVSILLKRQISAWHSWSLAMLIVLILNPLTILTESFWLSFATIALIIYGMGSRLAPGGLWWKWGRVQCVIGAGLLPVTAVIFQECSLISFIANSMAIPWLGCLVLPFCLLGSLLLFISRDAGYVILSLADKSLSGLWHFLTWAAQFHFTSLHFAIPSIGLFILIFVGFILLLLPAGMPGRWMGLVWIASIFAFQLEKPAHQHYWSTLLDVGQGLSAVIQTRHHVLVYDTGAKFKSGMDMGESVVAPFLRLQQIRKIDRLVISHADNDHAGGAKALLDAFDVSSITTSDPAALRIHHIYQTDRCIAGETWEWDGVTFAFLSPDANMFKQNLKHARNNLSCVLVVDNGKHKILLPGDIEKETENILLNQFQEKLKADIIVAPHHGSKTSGMQDFIAAVDPHIVLYATGYRNRYHFPHPSVVKTYAQRQVTSYNSATSGAIQFKLDEDDRITLPQEYRVVNLHYWYSPP